MRKYRGGGEPIPSNHVPSELLTLPSDYAQTILTVLSETDCKTAEIALRLAGALLDYRAHCEIAQRVSEVNEAFAGRVAQRARERAASATSLP
jgi:hypothetical protein